MAQGSNDEHDGGALSSELSEPEDSTMCDFIVEEENSQSNTSPGERAQRNAHNNTQPDSDDPIMLPSPRTPKRPKPKRKGPISRSIINTSEEEDTTALVGNDKMFARSGGVKTSLLPTGLVTRSQRRARSEYSEEAEPSASPSKRQRVAPQKVKADSNSDIEIVDNAPVADAGPPRVSPATPKRQGGPDSSEASSTLSDVTTAAMQAVTPVKIAAAAPNMMQVPMESVPPTQAVANVVAATPPSDVAFDVKSYVQQVMREQAPIMTSEILGALLPVIKSMRDNNQNESPTKVAADLRGDSDPTQPGAGSTRLDPSAIPRLAEDTLEHQEGPVMHMDAAFSSLSQGQSNARVATDEVVGAATPAARVGVSDLLPVDVTVQRPATSVPASEKEPVVGSASTSKMGSNSDLSTAAPFTLKVEMATEEKGKGKAIDRPQNSEKDVKALPGLALFADSDFDDEAEDDPVDPSGTADERKITPDSKCLDDLESYKNRFDPSVPCGVFDETLQDPKLAPTYVGLPPLPAGRYVYPSYIPPNQRDDESLGYANFSGWKKAVKGITRITLNSAMTVDPYGIYMNPTRTSPAHITLRPTGPGSINQRINYKGKVAICISPGLIVESWLTDSNARRKFIALLLHDQEWQRWESFMCLCFAEPFLYSPMTRLALHMGSVLNLTTQSQKLDSSLGSVMTSPRKSNASRSQRPPQQGQNSSDWRDAPGRTKYSYLVDEDIPIYNATGKNFDFNKDLPDLAELLPRWSGDILPGSFVVAGYTASGYKGIVGGEEGKQQHIGCNLVWAVVCGIPK